MSCPSVAETLKLSVISCQFSVLSSQQSPAEIDHLRHETEVRISAEVAEVGKDGANLRVGEAEPTGEGSGVLLDGGGGNEAACAEVVGLIDTDDRVLTVHVLALHSAANDEVVAAPAVVGSVGVGSEVRPKSEMVKAVTLLPRPCRP